MQQFIDQDLAMVVGDFLSTCIRFKAGSDLPYGMWSWRFCEWADACESRGRYKGRGRETIEAACDRQDCLQLGFLLEMDRQFKLSPLPASERMHFKPVILLAKGEDSARWGGAVSVDWTVEREFEADGMSFAEPIIDNAEWMPISIVEKLTRKPSPERSYINQYLIGG